MADVFAEIDEAMKQEKLQNLWEKYGGLIIGILVLIILGTIGNEVYKNWTDSTNQKQTEQMLALLDGENATLKKYYREREEIRLQPAHPTMKPIYVKENDLKIQGVVIGLLRKY